MKIAIVVLPTEGAQSRLDWQFKGNHRWYKRGAIIKILGINFGSQRAVGRSWCRYRIESLCLRKMRGSWLYLN
jgi:hypothetical protein